MKNKKRAQLEAQHQKELDSFKEDIATLANMLKGTNILNHWERDL